MYIVAEFIGKEGSMGLHHGKLYRLKVLNSNGFIHNRVEIVDSYPRTRIPYASLHAFFSNWDVRGRP